MNPSALKRLKYWWAACTGTVLIFGTLMHFVYHWSGGNKIIGLFSPVSESTWEHLKMLFYPMLLVILIGYTFFEHQYPGLLFAGTLGLCAGLAAIPVIFYTYTALLGHNILIFDILTFAVSVLLANILGYVIMRSRLRPLPDILCLLILTLLTAAFMIFTYAPPDFFIFDAP